MAHSLSAKKRVRQSETANARNRWRKRDVKEQVKVFLDAVGAGDKAKAAEAFREATKHIDKVTSAGTLHPNNAARRKSRLAAKLNAMTAKA